jgi:hypothetical protein
MVFTRSKSFWYCVSACSFLLSASSNFRCRGSMSALCLDWISSNDFRMSATSARKESRSRTRASNRSFCSVLSEPGSDWTSVVEEASPVVIGSLLLTDRSGRPIVSGSVPLDSSPSVGSSLASWGSFWWGLSRCKDFQGYAACIAYIVILIHWRILLIDCAGFGFGGLLLVLFGLCALKVGQLGGIQFSRTVSPYLKRQTVDYPQSYCMVFAWN